MTKAAHDQRRARVGRQRRSEQGLTLIELLLSLAILAVLTGFLAGGLSIGRRAFDADRVAEISSETDAAIQVIASLIGSALPAQPSTDSPKAGIVFDGRQQTLSFIGLSEGRAQQGGPHAVSLRKSGGEFIIEVAGSAPGAAGETSKPARVVALSGVREIRFSYFGSLKPAGQPSWQAEWFRAERLPNLVAIRIDFEDVGRNEPARIVALRQG